MASKLDIVYSRGQCKSVAPSWRLIVSFNDELDLEYVPPCKKTPTPVVRETWGTPKKVALDVVTTSESDEECTLTGTPCRSTLGYEGAYGSKESSGSEYAHSAESNEATASGFGSQGSTAVHHDSSDESQSFEFSPTLRHEDHTPVADQPNRWYV